MAAQAIGVYRGVREVAERYFATVLAHLQDDFGLEPHEVVDGGEAVVVLGRLGARGRLSGEAFETPFAAVWTFRDGRAARVSYHVDTAAIVRALAVEPVAVA